MTYRRKRVLREIFSMEAENPTLAGDYETYKSLPEIYKELEEEQQKLENVSIYVEDRINSICEVLLRWGFIDDKDNTWSLTKKGIIASKLQELNCMAFSEFLLLGDLDHLSAREIVSVLSAFTDLRVAEDYKQFTAQDCSESRDVCNVMCEIEGLFNKYYDIEMECNQYVDSKYTLVYDIQDEIVAWCDAKDEKTSIPILRKLYDKGIFLGSFIKAVLKINNIANELSGICDVLENVELKQKLSQIPDMTLKFVATNQSLYV